MKNLLVIFRKTPLVHVCSVSCIRPDIGSGLPSGNRPDKWSCMAGYRIISNLRINLISYFEYGFFFFFFISDSLRSASKNEIFYVLVS